HRMGFCGERDPQHVLGGRHLEIQRLRYLGLEPGHVAVADVAAVLTQMRGDAVGAGFNRRERRPYRIRPLSAARVTQGGDVIDINSETQRGNGHFGTRETFGRSLDIILRVPHPEERRLRRVSKDEDPAGASWFETAQMRLLT